MGKDFNPNKLDNLVGLSNPIHKKINNAWSEFRELYKEIGKEPTIAQIKHFAESTASIWE